MSLLVDIEKDLGGFFLQVRFESEGGVLGLLGPSGSGKSMTLKCIAGIERPDRGRIVLDGETLFDSEKMCIRDRRWPVPWPGPSGASLRPTASPGRRASPSATPCSR